VQHAARCTLHTPSRLRVTRGRADRVDAGADALKQPDHMDKDDAGENHAPQEPLAATERSGGFTLGNVIIKQLRYYIDEYLLFLEEVSARRVARSRHAQPSPSTLPRL
jgi:hypothetical protein